MILKARDIRDDSNYLLTAGKKYEVRLSKGLFPDKEYAYFEDDDGNLCVSYYWRFEIDHAEVKRIVNNQEDTCTS